MILLNDTFRLLQDCRRYYLEKGKDVDAYEVDLLIDMCINMKGDGDLFPPSDLQLMAFYIISYYIELVDDGVSKLRTRAVLRIANALLKASGSTDRFDEY